MEYLVGPDGSIERRDALEAVPVRERVIIPLHERDSSKGVASFWSRVQPRLTARARARFEAAMEGFWRLAPRATAALGRNGGAVTITGSFVWAPDGSERLVSLALNIEDRASPRRIFLRAEGSLDGGRTDRAPLIILRPAEAFLRLHDGSLNVAPDEPGGLAQRQSLRARIGEEVVALLEDFAISNQMISRRR
jgi:hypothetical protein